MKRATTMLRMTAAWRQWLAGGVLMSVAAACLAIAPGTMRPGSPQDPGWPVAPPTAGPGSDARWSEDVQRYYRTGDWSGLAAFAQRWLEAEPASPVAASVLGLAQLRLGRHVEAKTTLSAVAARFPQDDTSQLYLAWAHIGLGEAAQAEQIARRLLQRSASVAEAFVVLAYAHLLGSRIDDALAAVEAGLKAAPDFIGLWLARAEVLDAQGRHAPALEAIEQAARFGVLDDDAQRKRALLLARIGRIDEARRHLAGFAAAVAFDAVIWNQIGIESVRRGRRDEAEAAYVRATEIGPKWITPWVNLASLHQQADRWSDAERIWRRALMAHPEDPSALSGLAQALTLLGERSEAAAVLQRAEQAKPGGVEDLRALGAAYFNLNQWRAAAAKYEQATRLDAGQATDWIYLGNAYFALRQRDAAREAYARAEAIERDHPALLNALARLHGDSGNFELALKYSDRGTQLRPNDALLWNAKGYSLLQLGRFKEAVTALDAAAKLQPRAPAVWINLGQAHLRLRAFPEAVRALQQAVGLAPMAPDARIYLARALASTGQWQAAEANLDYLLQRAPNTAEAWYVLGLIGFARGAAKDYQLAYDELLDFAPAVAADLKRRTSGKPPADPAVLFQ